MQKGEDLDPESQRLLEKSHKAFVALGSKIPAGPGRDRFKEILTSMSELAFTFQKNLNEEKGGIWFDRNQLEGVPDDLLSGLEQGQGNNTGKLRVTFRESQDIIGFARNPATRKAFFIGYENRVNENIPVVRELLLLRDESARLLGYPNHAALVRAILVCFSLCHSSYRC